MNPQSIGAVASLILMLTLVGLFWLYVQKVQRLLPVRPLNPASQDFKKLLTSCRAMDLDKRLRLIAFLFPNSELNIAIRLYPDGYYSVEAIERSQSKSENVLDKIHNSSDYIG